MTFVAPCKAGPFAGSHRTTFNTRREQFNLFKQSHIGHAHILSPGFVSQSASCWILHAVACWLRIPVALRGQGSGYISNPNPMQKLSIRARPCCALGGPVCGLADASPAHNMMMYKTTNNFRKLFAHGRRSVPADTAHRTTDRCGCESSNSEQPHRAGREMHHVAFCPYGRHMQRRRRKLFCASAATAFHNICPDTT